MLANIHTSQMDHCYKNMELDGRLTEDSLHYKD